MAEFTTTHNLPFECKPWMIDVEKFRVGTVTGIYKAENDSYVIIGICNSEPGNGHFEDVLQWFERSCRRDNYSLQFVEIMNKKFGRHLIEKRGFKPYENGLIKHFK